MIKQEKWKQYGFERTEPIEFIVIHNTSSELSASELFDWLEEKCLSSQGTHYLVDFNGVIEVMPLEWSVYHTGKGVDIACKRGIAIEICSNLNDDLYLEGENKAMGLVKELMQQYNLTRENIYYHNDFNPQTHCPNDIMNRYKNKKEFLDTYLN